MSSFPGDTLGQDQIANLIGVGGPPTLAPSARELRRGHFGGEGFSIPLPT